MYRIEQCIAKYNFVYSVLFCFPSPPFKYKQAAFLSYIMRKQSKIWMSKDEDRVVLAGRMKNVEIEGHYPGTENGTQLN